MLGLAALMAAPAELEARHRHGRDCGHVYSRDRGGWVSIEVYGRRGGFSYQGGRGPYADPYDGRRYDRRRGHRGHGRYYDRYDRFTWREFKRHKRFYKKRYPRHRHRGHSDWGPFCPWR